jgi:hypothetical protein
MADLYYSSVARETTLTSGIDEVDTQISVGATLGFPLQFPYKLILDRDTPIEEVVYVTNAAGTTLTVMRGRDGTVGQSHEAGATVVHGATGDDFQRAANHRNATTGIHGLAPGVFPASGPELADLAALVAAHLASTSAHGVSGNIVGTNGVQTLRDKIIDGTENSLFVPWSQLGPRAFIRRTKSSDQSLGAGNISKLQTWQTQRSFGDAFEHPFGTGTVRPPHTGLYLMNYRLHIERTNTNQTGGFFLQFRMNVNSTANDSGSVVRQMRQSQGSYMGSGARFTLEMNDFVHLRSNTTYSFTARNTTGHSMQIYAGPSVTSWSLMYFGPSAGTDELPDDPGDGGGD